MNDDIKLLNTITEAADMGRDSLNHILRDICGSPLKTALIHQYVEYDDTYKAAEKMLHKMGEDAKKPGRAVKAYSHMVSNMKTAVADNEFSKIAEMLIEGTTMGVTELTKQLNACRESTPEVKTLAEKHLRAEQSNIEEMKQFL